MGTKPNNFRKTEARRLIQAVLAAGQTVTSIEVEGGRVKVNTGKPESTNAANPWDEVNKGAKHGATAQKRIA